MFYLNEKFKREKERWNKIVHHNEYEPMVQTQKGGCLVTCLSSVLHFALTSPLEKLRSVFLYLLVASFTD